MNRPAIDAVHDVLSRLVLKSHVGLGGLPVPQRDLSLALVASALPSVPMREREVNDALRTALTDAVCFLDIDHVSLRRWLVDTRWLTRDGYGREYRVVAASQLDAPQRDLQDALRAAMSAEPPAQWVTARRARAAAERAARRETWRDAPTRGERP